MVIAVSVVITVSPVIPISMVPVTVEVIVEPVRVDFSVMNIPVSPDVIPIMPSDFIGDSLMVDDYPSSVSIMV